MAAKIASLEALNQSKEKEAELKKYADTYPEITLGEEIDRLHFQDASAKQTLKDLVLWPNPMTKPFLKRNEYEYADAKNWIRISENLIDRHWEQNNHHSWWDKYEVLYIAFFQGSMVTQMHLSVRRVQKA